jgi:CRP-like cAMP-binding protein
MTHPQPSILQTFDFKASLPLLPDRVWLVERGIVRTLTWDDDGQVTTLGLWGRGDIVGLPLTRLSPYEIECLTSVAVTELPPGVQTRDWQQLLLNHLWRSQELFSLVQTVCLRVRLLKLLHWLAARFGRELPQGMLLPPLLTHKQFSEILGSSRVTVTRLLNILEQQGQLKRFRKRGSERPLTFATPGSSRAILLPHGEKLPQARVQQGF